MILFTEYYLYSQNSVCTCIYEIFLKKNRQDYKYLLLQLKLLLPAFYGYHLFLFDDRSYLIGIVFTRNFLIY